MHNNATTIVFSKNLKAYIDGYRIIINQGSSGSSKNYSIIQLLNEIAKAKKNKTIHILGISVPHLKDGAIADFINILQNANEWNDKKWNITDKEYSYNSGSKIKFISVDKIGKAQGPRRDILYINECNHIKWDIVSQLFIRTRETIFLDYNPISIFWLHRKYEGFKDNHKNLELYNSDPKKYIKIKYIHSTFLDNEFYGAEERKLLLKYKETDHELWKIYGLGELGAMTGLIFPNWKIVNEIPIHSISLGFWLDFGYSNSQTALGQMYKADGELYLKEYIYETGLINTINIDNQQQKSIEQRLIENNISKKAEIYADKADPKSIRELRLSGYNIKPAPKFQGSVNLGIMILKRCKVNILNTSKNIIMEKENYCWKENKNNIGESDMYINEPIKKFDHHIDGIRGLAIHLDKLKKI